MRHVKHQSHTVLRKKSGTLQSLKKNEDSSSNMSAQMLCQIQFIQSGPKWWTNCTTDTHCYLQSNAARLAITQAQVRHAISDQHDKGELLLETPASELTEQDIDWMNMTVTPKKNGNLSSCQSMHISKGNHLRYQKTSRLITSLLRPFSSPLSLYLSPLSSGTSCLISVGLHFGLSHSRQCNLFQLFWGLVKSTTTCNGLNTASASCTPHIANKGAMYSLWCLSKHDMRETWVCRIDRKGKREKETRHYRKGFQRAVVVILVAI